MNKPLPIGIDDFKKLRDYDSFYVDKTSLIKELLDNRNEVTLFMRPRRFGKTLSLSMLKYFFEKVFDKSGKEEDNSYLFTGLGIMRAGDNYTKHMGQYPVISLSMKSAKQPSFDKAYGMLKRQIANEFRRHLYVVDRLEESDRDRYYSIMRENGDELMYLDSLAFLSRVLMEVYGKKSIILLDEYDVPLENAYFNGFYK